MSEEPNVYKRLGDVIDVTLAREEANEAAAKKMREECHRCGVPLVVETLERSPAGTEYLSAVHHNCPRTPEKILGHLLTAIGSWTSARWDQQVRFEFGDVAAEELIAWLVELGVPAPRVHKGERLSDPEDPNERGALVRFEHAARKVLNGMDEDFRVPVDAFEALHDAEQQLDDIRAAKERGKKR